MSALQRFLRQELPRRGWSVEEFGRRAQISTSSAYNLWNGQDNVRQQTFENVAAAFGMTSSELTIAIGAGIADLAPDEMRLISHYRQAPPEKRSDIEDIARLYARVEPIRPQPNRPKRAKANREIPHSVEMEHDMPHGGDFGPGGGIAPWYHVGPLHTLVRLGRLAHAS